MDSGFFALWALPHNKANQAANEETGSEATDLYCCPDYPSCPASAIQVGWATWAIWAAIKEYSPNTSTGQAAQAANKEIHPWKISQYPVQ